MDEGIIERYQKLISSMSHEIRTPMNSIIGFTELLQKTPLNEEQSEFVDMIQMSGENLLAIVSDILDFSMIEANKLKLSKKSINLFELLENIVKLFFPSSKKKNLDIILHVDSSIPDRVIADPVRLNQIFVNLVGNSIKFTEKGSITIQAKKIKENDNSTDILFTVQDTGIGIEESEREHIFESFRQVKKNTKYIQGGTGLGLNIVKYIVEKMNGKIYIESEVNKGTIFSVELSFKKSTDTIQRNGKKENNNKVFNDLSGLKILVAEDNELNMILTKKLLVKINIEVITAVNGMEAVNKTRLEHPELILMDIQMPVMDGISATESIRKLNTSVSKTPIIAMTANALKTEEEICLRSGMDGYISKPFKPSQLYNIIYKVYTERKNKEKFPDSNGLNLEYLFEQSKSDGEFAAELIETFIDSAPLLIEQIRTELRTKQFEEVKKLVHKLKNSLMFVAAKEIVNKTSLIEKEENKNIIAAEADELCKVSSEIVSNLSENREKFIKCMEELHNES